MQITPSILSKLFDVLKNGDSRGVSLYHSIEEAAEDSNFLEKLYHAAINEGFAEPGTIQVYGLDMSLRLSGSARGYSSYSDFKDRNIEKPATINNKTITINAPMSGSVFQDSSLFADRIANNANVPPSQNAKIGDNEKTSIAVKLGIFFGIVTTIVSIIQIGEYIYKYVINK